VAATETVVECDLQLAEVLPLRFFATGTQQLHTTFAPDSESFSELSVLCIQDSPAEKWSVSPEVLVTIDKVEYHIPLVISAIIEPVDKVK
jgi:hypothetical protein